MNFLLLGLRQGEYILLRFTQDIVKKNSELCGHVLIDRNEFIETPSRWIELDP